MTTTATNHIVLDDRGVAWIEDANTKVVEVVCDYKAYGWSVDEMHKQHPHLSRAQLHAAMAYYFDHQQEIDEDIERRLKEVERMAAEAGETPGRRGLRERGLIR
jgi:uncharacterized protein (DUF433 family)